MTLASICLFLLGMLALSALFFASECMHYQRGHETWPFVEKAYHRYNLGRIRW